VGWLFSFQGDSSAGEFNRVAALPAGLSAAQHFTASCYQDLNLGLSCLAEESSVKTLF